ncbi:DUF6484 domain-containing protein [Falsiroseomonas sp. HW251]|uniref:DUF6484 domain-containing protein n=1 Tax=Falsiroseomonas sp. HW251 TaxID=3390998 RepID=UPI003D322489
MSSLRGRKSSRTESVATAGKEVALGRVCGLDEAGGLLVDYEGNPAGAPLPALSTTTYDAGAAGREVALIFIDGDPLRPLALGLVRPGARPAPTAAEPEELVLTAKRDVTLRCGRASITLTRAGKVLVRGTYLSLRSSGMQRITGASVQIN